MTREEEEEEIEISETNFMRQSKPVRKKERER